MTSSSSSESRTLSALQIEVLRIVANGNEDKSFVDVQQIIERAPNKASREAFLCLLQTLIRRELVERKGKVKRGKRMHMLFAATTLGQHYAGALSVHRDAKYEDKWRLEDGVIPELEALTKSELGLG
jgi:DNA-binding IclR family transcriptional regulator